MENKEPILTLTQEIVELEWQMFSQVHSQYPVSCQQNPDVFKAVRSSIFEVWPEELLSAYLDELKSAQKAGRNLLTEKYARMDKLIPPRTTNPLIPKIVEIELAWQMELQENYPALYQRVCRLNSGAEDGSNFAVYLACELETYGGSTIDLYYHWVREVAERGENVSIQMLETLVLRGGFQNLAQAEKYFNTTHQAVGGSHSPEVVV